MRGDVTFENKHMSIVGQPHASSPHHAISSQEHPRSWTKSLISNCPDRASMHSPNQSQFHIPKTANHKEKFSFFSFANRTIPTYLIPSPILILVSLPCGTLSSSNFSAHRMTDKMNGERRISHGVESACSPINPKYLVIIIRDYVIKSLRLKLGKSSRSKPMVSNHENVIQSLKPDRKVDERFYNLTAESCTTLFDPGHRSFLGTELRPHKLVGKRSLYWKARLYIRLYRVIKNFGKCRLLY